MLDEKAGIGPASRSTTQSVPLPDQGQFQGTTSSAYRVFHAGRALDFARRTQVQLCLGNLLGHASPRRDGVFEH
jgi:hypothetical protein